MRIAMLSPVAPVHGKGGVQDVVWSLARSLAARRHEVTLITTARVDGVITAAEDGVSLRYLEGTPPMRAAGRWAGASAAAVETLHRARPLDVIHSQSFCGVHLAGRFPGVPVVASLHGTHVDELRTCERLLRENLAGFALRQAARSAYVWLMMARRLRGEGRRLRDCDAVIATSREQRALLAREYGVPEARLFDVWNGIDVDRFTPRPADAATRAALGAVEHAPLVLAVARLYQDKGIQHLLRAFPAVLEVHPNARLAIVGDGAYRGELESQAAALRLGGRARFLGAASLDQLPAYYAAADVFVNPTVRINGYDLTILQAMAMARPVVVSNLGSVPTAVADGDDGYLVTPGDPRALAAAILRVIADPAASAAVAERAHRTVAERFSVRAMCDGTLRVYERAIATRRATTAAPDAPHAEPAPERAAGTAR
jgi:glycogen(starch) synthase